MKLNERQERAVHALDGPVLITAGAGSGKTRVLAERFVAAVGGGPEHAREPVSARRIAAITFSEKAASEIEARVRLSLRGRGLYQQAREVDQGWISTIHGLCARLLRRYALEAGIDPEFAVADTVIAGELEALAFEQVAREALASDEGAALFGLHRVDAVREAVRDLTGLLSRNGLAPDALRVEPAGPVGPLLARAVEAFCDADAGLGDCSPAPSVQTHRAACGGAIEALRALSAEDMPDALLAEELRRVVTGYGGTKRATNEAKELLESLWAEREAIAREASAIALAGPARGLVALTNAYSARYSALKRERGLLDFDDLQSLTLTLLGTRPDLARRVADEIDLMMVDEFQDTDALQLAIVESIAGDDLCTVGDERQSIYRFRGADVDVYREHAERMQAAGAVAVELNENYRSHAGILDFVNGVFGHESLFGSHLVRLAASRAEAEPPVVDESSPRVHVTLTTGGGRASGPWRRVEARELAATFAELRDTHGVSPGDMVVLLRTYAPAEDYTAALRDQGFHTVVLGGSRFLALPVIAQARALLRAVANPEDEVALATVLASPIGGVSDDGLLRLRRAADSVGHRSLWAALRDGEAGLSPEDDHAAARTAGALVWAQERIGRVPLSEVILRAMEDTGFDLWVLSQGREGRQEYANLLKLARLADDFETGSSGRSGPAEFSAYLDVKEELGDVVTPAALPDDATPAVRIMSIHASKGLEFPVVAVPELAGGNRGDRGIHRRAVSGGEVRVALTLPDDGTKAEYRRTPWFVEIDALAKAAELEETKRLFYVACTRAREVLLLSGAACGKAGAVPENSMLGLLAIGLGLSGPVDAGIDEERTADSARYRLRTLSVAGEAETPAEEQEDAAEALPPAPARAPRPLPDVPAPSSAMAGMLSSQAPRRLSYSDFNLYERCSLRFWAEKILRAGALDLPASAGDADSRGFGGAFHACVEMMGPDGVLPAEDRISAIATYHRLGDEQRIRLDVALRAWTASGLAGRLDAAEHVRRELPFQIEVGEAAERFILVGALDALAEVPGGALVVDYKTGESGEAENLAARYALQARCYALVALRNGARRVEVRFVRPEVPGEAGEPQEIAFDFTVADATGIEQELLGMRARMVAGEFEPLRVWDRYACAECRIAGGICPISGSRDEPSESG